MVTVRTIIRNTTCCYTAYLRALLFWYQALIISVYIVLLDFVMDTCYVLCEVVNGLFFI